MQFLDIYQQDDFLVRIPLGETDLMTFNGNWDEDVVLRERVVRFMLRQLFKNKHMMALKRPEYYLVFESKMNLVASDIATSEDCCDAPFILTNSIEQ